VLRAAPLENVADEPWLARDDLGGHVRGELIAGLPVADPRDPLLELRPLRRAECALVLGEEERREEHLLTTAASEQRLDEPEESVSIELPVQLVKGLHGVANLRNAHAEDRSGTGDEGADALAVRGVGAACQRPMNLVSKRLAHGVTRRGTAWPMHR